MSLTILLFLFTNICSAASMIMLDPAGDVRHVGRSFTASFERGITLRICQELKKKLEAQCGAALTVMLTRSAGDTVEFLQNAHIANRLPVDVYVSVHCFAQSHGIPELSLYHFSNNPVVDRIPYGEQLLFVPHDQAQRIAFETTQQYAMTMHRVLSIALDKIYTVKKPCAIPFKPLIGIKAPAIAIEIGLAHDDAWTVLIDPLVAACKAILYEHT